VANTLKNRVRISGSIDLEIRVRVVIPRKPKPKATEEQKVAIGPSTDDEIQMTRHSG